MWQGLLAGLFAGAFSTLAHMGGLVVVMYLLPQRLGNNAFVATTTATYFLLNFIKIPFYFQLDLFSFEILIEGHRAPSIHWAGGTHRHFALNNRVPELLFSRIVLFLLIRHRYPSITRLIPITFAIFALSPSPGRCGFPTALSTRPVSVNFPKNEPDRYAETLKTPKPLFSPVGTQCL